MADLAKLGKYIITDASHWYWTYKPKYWLRQPRSQMAAMNPRGAAGRTSIAVNIRRAGQGLSPDP